MTLSAQELANVAGEVSRALTGRSVQKIVQTGPATVLLGWKGAWVLVSADARRGRLHLLDEKPPGSGEAATAFCMQLRKELVGARLVGCEAVPGERAAELRFLRRENELGLGAEGGRFVEVARSLRLFLFGRAAQLSLHDGDGAVLGRIGPAQRVHGALPSARPDPSPLDRFAGDGSYSSRIQAYYDRVEETEAAAEAHAEGQAQLQKTATKLRRKRDALAGDLERASSSDEVRRRADLILASLGTLGVVPRGTRSVTVSDLFGDGSLVEIALDPTRTPQELAGRLHKQAKRLGQARKTIAARLAQVEAELLAVSTALAGEGPLPAALRQAIAVEAGRGQGGGKAAERQRTAPYHEFRSLTGVTILVGRGAERNDELTFRVARGADLWLHTRDAAGAHVIVVLDGRPVDQQTLLDAATLAAHHSQARDERQVDVGYTLRKHVRKPPKARPGQVITSGLKTLRVRLEPDRLQRLLASRV